MERGVRRRWARRVRRAALGGCVVAGAACAPEAPDYVHFVAFGDMGTGGAGQQRVADAIARRSVGEPLDFILTLGDNFYPAGVLSEDDPLWERVIEDVYSAPSLQVPIYPTLGNHDHQGYPHAQVDYALRNQRWSMPAPYYAFSRTLATGERVDFFALDTERIRAGLDGQRDPASLDRRVASVRRTLDAWNVTLPEHVVRYIAERIHGADEFTVSRIVHVARRTGRDVDEALIDHALEASVPEDYREHLAWLDEGLAASTARWKIVFGHHPLYGHHPTRGHQRSMIERVEPILVRHGVDLYIAGHDHLTDVIKPVKGVHYVTSGEGGGDDHPYPIDETDESFYVQTGGGFTLFRVSADRIEVEVADIDGTRRHRTTIRK